MILHNYNVLSHSHVIIWWLGLIAGGGVEIRRWGGGEVLVSKREPPDFRSPEACISGFPVVQLIVGT